MKTLAAINGSPYEQAAKAIDEYHQTVKQGLAAFVRAQGGLRPQPGKRKHNCWWCLVLTMVCVAVITNSWHSRLKPIRKVSLT